METCTEINALRSAALAKAETYHIQSRANAEFKAHPLMMDLSDNIAIYPNHYSIWVVSRSTMPVLTPAAAHRLAGKQIDLKGMDTASSIYGKLVQANTWDVATAIKFAKTQKKDSLYDIERPFVTD